MERRNTNFRKFCGADIAKLKGETDPSTRIHLMRRINTQMYAEACKQNYDDFTILDMLSANLDDYIKESVPVHQANFEKMMKELKININPTKFRPPEIASELLKSAKCEGTCKNDLLLDELDQFFNSMKKKPLLPPSISKVTASSCPKPEIASKIDDPFEVSIEDSTGDLVFETNFKRKRNSNQTVQSSNQPGPSSTSGLRDNRFTVNRFSSEHSNYNSAPVLSSDNQTHSTRNTFNSFSALKRKSEEPENNSIRNNFYKKPTYLPKPEPQPDDEAPFVPKCDFKSASEELTIQYNKKHNINNQNDNFSYNSNPSGGLRRSLGGRRTVKNGFTPPFANQENNTTKSNSHQDEMNLHGIDMSHPRLKNVDPKMIETISNEILDHGDQVDWRSIAGLEHAKKVIMEAVVLPILRPDIFTGLRRPPRGVLLFGPPGTGKTLICKCIASQSKSTFFSISASSLTSKWIGEGEKMVRALFAVAAALQPSVVFIDEVDSLLCQRSESEHESSRRLKTEFLVQLDGAGTTEDDRILIVGATNRPQELDEAARRRFVKRLYIPLPEFGARCEIMVNLLTSVNHVIEDTQLEEIARRTDGYSGADMKVLCQEAVMGPVRSISFTDMQNVAIDCVRPVNFNDFLNALNCVRASVSPGDLKQYVDWNNTYGSGGGK